MVILTESSDTFKQQPLSTSPDTSEKSSSKKFPSFSNRKRVSQANIIFVANIFSPNIFFAEHFESLRKYFNLDKYCFYGFKTIFNLNLSDQMPDNPHLRLFWSNSCSHKSLSHHGGQSPRTNPLVKINWFGFWPNRLDGIISLRRFYQKMHGQTKSSWPLKVHSQDLMPDNEKKRSWTERKLYRKWTVLVLNQTETIRSWKLSTLEVSDSWSKLSRKKTVFDSWQQTAVKINCP